MPEKSKYNLVDEALDDVFQQGICFEVKFIGSLDIVKPRSRLEILAAMRRIRYEFKVKNIKKMKVSLVVAVDGIKVILRQQKKKNALSWDESQVIMAQDPIYRIFYVSHDSQDLKIFSYIARDKKSNVFRCNVFKSKRKSQAMRIVRTVGQAFEVCHKQSLDTVDAWLEKGEEENNEEEEKTSPLDASTEESVQIRDPKVSEDLVEETAPPGVESPLSQPLSGLHQLQLLQRQLQQQEQKGQVASAQAILLQQQLSVETRARADAQARVQQLLRQNSELLQHLSLLVKHVQDLELRTRSASSMGSQDSLLEIALRANISPIPALPSPPRSCSTQDPSISQISGPRSGPVQPGRFRFFPATPDLEKKPEQDRDSGQGPDEESPSNVSPTECPFFSTMETPGFRESGIASGYESNTDESDDRDSWGQ